MRHERPAVHSKMGFRASGLACPALDLPVSEEGKRYLAEKGRNSGILRQAQDEVERSQRLRPHDELDEPWATPFFSSLVRIEGAKTYEMLSILSSEKGAL